MRRTRIAAIALCIATLAALGTGVAAGAGCDYPVTVEDATGTNVTLDAPPDRIVTGGASTDQTLWTIGAEDRVVGMWVRFSHLSGAEDRTEVYGGSFTNALDDETVIGLSPDVVLVSNVVTDAEVGELRSKGLTVYKFRTARDLPFVYEKTLDTGALTGHCTGAEQTVDDMQERVQVVEKTLSYSDRPRVFYNMGGMHTVGSDTFTGSALAMAGADNIADDANISGWQQISEEEVLEHDPEWILTTPHASIPDSLENTTAVQKNQTHEIASRYLNQPAPILVDGIEELAETFYPDLFDTFKYWWEYDTGSGIRRINLTDPGQNHTVTIPNNESRREVITAIADDVGLTMRFDASASGDVSVARVSPIDVPALRSPGEPVTTWRIESEDSGSVGTAELRFRIDRETIEDHDVDAADLAVHHRRDDGWKVLPSKTESTNTTVNVSAVTEEFSVFTVAATSAPVARIGLPADRVEPGVTVTLNASASSTRYGSIDDVEWRVADERYVGETVDLTFDEPGEHEIASTVTNRAGLNDTATATLTVDAPDDPDGSATDAAEPTNASATDETADDAEEETPGQPGFTPAVALVAMVATLALTRRAG